MHLYGMDPGDGHVFLMLMTAIALLTLAKNGDRAIIVM